MSNGPGRGALIGGLVVVLAIAVGVLLMSSEPKDPETNPATAGQPVEQPAEHEPGYQSDNDPSTVLPVDTSGQTPVSITPTEGMTRKLPVEMPVVARGRVTTAGGALPPEGVDVELWDADGSPLDSTVTEPDGAYELRWDEPLAAGWAVGTDSVTMEVDGDFIDLAPSNGGALPLHLPSEPAVEVNFALGVAPLLTGHVSDRVTGAPIAMADVSAYSTAQASLMESCDTMTDEDGNYELPLEDLPLTGLILVCRTDEHQAQVIGPQDVRPAARADEALRFDFALEAAVPWRGRVISALSGQPVEGATITIGSDFSAFSDEFDFEVTDAEGAFTLNLPYVPAQGAWVHVQADEFAAGAVRDIAPGREVLIRLSPAITLVGRVTVDGTPPARAADIQVFFDGETYWGDNGLYDQGYTDKQGAFEVQLEYAPPTEARIRVDAVGCAPWEARLMDVARPAGNGQLQVDVQLIKAE